MLPQKDLEHWMKMNLWVCALFAGLCHCKLWGLLMLVECCIWPSLWWLLLIQAFGAPMFFEPSKLFCCKPARLFYCKPSRLFYCKPARLFYCKPSRLFGCKPSMALSMFILFKKIHAKLKQMSFHHNVLQPVKTFFLVVLSLKKIKL